MSPFPIQPRHLGRGSGLRIGIAIWSTLAAVLLIGVTFVWAHFQGEHAIHHVGAAASAVSEARNRLTDAFLQLALHEDDSDEAYAARAQKELDEVSKGLDQAVSLVEATPGAGRFGAELSAFNGQVSRLRRELIARRRTDVTLEQQYAALNLTGARLDAEGQRLWVDAGNRLDTIFARTVAGLAIILTAIIVGVTVGTAAHRRLHTARDLAEADARRQAKLLKAIAAGTSDSVFLKDLNGRYLYVNRAAAEFFGKTVDEILGKDDIELFEARDAARLIDNDRRLMTENRSETLEETLTAAGETRTYLVTKGPMHDENAAVVGLIGVSCDITARKRDEQALRDSEKRLELALAAAGMGVWAVDMRTGDIYWSREIYEMTGRTTPPHGFKEFFDFILPEDRAMAAAVHEEALRRGTRIEMVVRHRRDGEIRWLSITGEVRFDDAGVPWSLQGVSSDVTSRMRTEEALRASEERYRRFLDLLPDAVFVVEDDRIAYCNPAFVALRGAEVASELIGTSVFQMYPEDAHRSVRSRLDDLFTNGGPLAPIERRLLRPDGRSVPVLVTATQVVDASRRAVLAVLRDLSRQHHAEAWAQSILSHTLDGIISTDQYGTITSFNSAAESSLGYAADEVLGCHISLVVPDSAPSDLGQRREVNGRRKDGSTVPIDVAVSAFELDGERHIIAVARDISERRRLESDLRQAHKMEALGQVAGGVAHDFNNLLTVILGYSDMLQEQFPEGDPRRQFASDIRRASGRAADLTRQLLTFSRRTVVAPKVIDVNAVVKDMNRMLRRVLGEDIDLVVSADPSVRPIFIDPGSLEQIVMNLCVNARDAMPTGGRLLIATGGATRGDGIDAAGRPITLGDYVTVTVTDTGDGIPADVCAHIFEPFFTTKGVGKGTGLGLAVVLGLVEQNGGHILLDTAPRRGTTFTVALPMADQAITVVPESGIRPPRGGGETILVVEDEEPVRRLAVIALASAGYRVLDAADGRAALAVFDHHQGSVDLLLTDVVMPHVGGRELVLSLLARRPQLRVIYTSGYADDAVLRHGISRADVQFLAKPYTPAGLLQKVREVIDLSPALASNPPPA